MQPNPKHPYCDIACFAVVLPFVDSIQSALKVKFSSRIEWQTAIADIPMILRRIIRGTHVG